jgi:SAM-dependent methyltransferase
MSDLKRQYERYPYPPISRWALPRRKEGAALQTKALHAKNPKILVIGGGTLEPLVVAQAYPQASEILNIDLSKASIDVLKHRLWLHKIARPFSKRASIRSLCGDFRDFTDCGFDYVIASNVLHHMDNPAQALLEISKRLKPGGILRMVTYPKMSRIWMKATSQFLKLRKVDRAVNIKKVALQAVRELPISHPIRACYESHQERMNDAGIVDAFFNACENPLSPLEWQRASGASGLQLFAETQDKNSHSDLIGEFLGTHSEKIDRWKKLQILDDTWELCSNPILWFEKTREPVSSTVSAEASAPSQESILEQIIRAAKQADSLLREADSNLQEWIEWLRKEVGPRTWPNHPDEILRGLSMTEYPIYIAESVSISSTD